MDALGTGLTRLVDLAAAGDAPAFERLVGPLAARLLLYVRWRGGRLLAGDFDEEDVLQSVLATVWRKLPEFEYRGPQAFYRWTVAIADGALGDRKKYLAAEKRPDLRHLESERPGAPGPLDPADPATNISRKAVRREEWERVDRALLGLSEEDRAVVERHLLEARSVREIAEELGIGKSTVWDRLDRAMTQLRAALGAST